MEKCRICGDAYASALIYGILEDLPIEKTLEMASAHAAMLVQSHSCSEDMKTVEEINTFIVSKEIECVTKL